MNLLFLIYSLLFKICAGQINIQFDTFSAVNEKSSEFTVDTKERQFFQL